MIELEKRSFLLYEHRRMSRTYIVETRETKVRKLDLPAVVDQNVGALDITVQEVFLVAVAKTIEQLFHDRGVELLRELNKSGIEQSHEIVVHELENQVKRTLLFPAK